MSIEQDLRNFVTSYANPANENFIIPNPEKTYLSVETGAPSFEIEIEGLDVNITIASAGLNIGDEALTLSSSSLAGAPWRSGKLDKKKFSRIRHDLVLLGLSGHFNDDDIDVPLQRLGNLPDGYNGKTPDRMIQMKDAVIVYELKTTLSRALEPVYIQALEKYQNAIQRRSPSKDRKVFYFVIVANDKQVFSNAPISETTKAVIKSHFLLGEAIVADAIAKSYPFDLDEDVKFAQSVLNKVMAAINKESKLPEEAEPPLISKKMLNHWYKTEITKEDKAAFILNLQACATETINKKIIYREELHKTITRYYDSWDNSHKGRWINGIQRMDEKAIAPFPLLRPKNPPDYNKVDQYLSSLPPVVIGMGGIHGKLWENCIESAYANPENFVEETVQLTLDRTLSETKEFERSKWATKKTNRHYHRVKPNMSGIDRIELALEGIQGKGLKETLLMKENHERHQMPFSRLVNVQDIEDFSNNSEHFNMGSNWNLPDREIAELIQIARSHWLEKGDSSIGEDFIKLFCSTKIGNELTVLSSVIEELNFSLNHYCSKDEFEIKRVPFTDIFLLLKPTTAEKSIFCSMMHQNNFESMGKPFKETVKAGEYGLTSQWNLSPFFSLTRHKVGHYLYAQYKAAVLFALVCHIYSMHPLDALHKLANNNGKVEEILVPIVKTFNTFLMCYLEDKPQTSENLMLIRYAYMECAKHSIMPPDPLKVLKKVTNMPRSRLLVFVLKRVIEVFSEMQLNPPKVLSFDEETLQKLKIDSKVLKEISDNPRENISQEAFVGMISWITKGPIFNYQIALEESYVGVLHNKEEGDEFQGYLKIFSKIISEELIMHDPKVRKEFMGYGSEMDPRKVQDHEFNLKWVLWCSELTRKYLNDQNGGKFDEVFEAKLMYAMQHKTAEGLATLKASAVRPVGDTWSKDLQMNKRRRVLEGILELLYGEKTTNLVFSGLEGLLEDLETWGGVMANLFKKLQHGGPREIFVLDIVSRIVVNYLETIARTINEMLPNEMLTKGDGKMLRSDLHYNQVYTRKNDKKSQFEEMIHCIDSGDATKWCQRFVMPVFGAMYSRLLPKKYHIPIMRVLNLITTKSLELPKALLDKYYNDPKERSFDAGMNKFKEEFLGYDPGMLVKHALAIFLINLCNMMQGILHYNSSLLHASNMFGYTIVVKTLFYKMKEQSIFDQNDEMIVTTKVSSDDSSCLRSILTQKVITKWHYIFSTLCSYIRRCVYGYFCAAESDEKSTIAGFSNLEEFNSVWMFANTVMVPLIKFVFAATNARVIAGMDSRQNLMSDLRKQIVENGGSAVMSSIVQSAQCRIHYITIGCNSNKLFPIYKKMIVDKPHPVLGFFLYEPEMLSGVMGYDFALYGQLKHNKRSSAVERYLIEREGAEVNEFGKPSVTLSLLIGRGEKYNGFLKRLNEQFSQNRQKGGWKDIALENPEMLFRQSRTIDESIFHIYQKAFTPSSADAFSFQAASKIHAAAVYLLSECSVVVKVKTEEIEEKDGKKIYVSKLSKQSLMKFANDVIIKEPLNNDLMFLLFPNSEVYDAIMLQLEESKNMQIVKLNYKRPNRIIEIPIPKSKLIAPLSLWNVVRKKWFEKLKVQGTDTEHDASFKQYQKLLPWLSDKKGILGLEETMSKCPFRDIIALAEFCRSLSPSIRHSKVLGPLQRNVPMLEQLKHYIMKCFMQGFELIKTTGKTRSFGLKTSTLASNLLLISQCATVDKPTKLNLFRTYLQQSDRLIASGNQELIQSQLLTVSKREAIIALFQCFAAGIEIGNLIAAAKRGVTGYFKSRQTMNKETRKYQGYGHFVGVMDGRPFELTMRDDSLTGMYIRPHDALFFAKHIIEMKKLLAEIDTTKITPANNAKIWFDLTKLNLQNKSSTNSIPV
jgi:hypothetical protein